MYKNIQEAFVNNVLKIDFEGKEVESRGSKQKEILSNFFQIEKPEHRVITVPHRNNNIFATVAETIWVLSGRNDMKFLTKYLPRALEFSDDGLVWRGAYGPRLRDWNGVDQFKTVLNRFRQDIHTKRAVISIYDPYLDSIEVTKDIPCNNWINFNVRENVLHMNVSVRANDAIWGFSGINSFEWSVLQQIFAYWLGCNIGNLSWFAGSFHVYERHYDLMKKIIFLKEIPNVYDLDIPTLTFCTPFIEFDKLLKECFEIEEMFFSDASVEDVLNVIRNIQDPLFNTFMLMLFEYHLLRNTSDIDKINEINAEIPCSDLKLAALEYMIRNKVHIDRLSLNAHEREFLYQYQWIRGK